jgi:DNA-binding NarL/FixJ family response regulator
MINNTIYGYLFAYSLILRKSYPFTLSMQRVGMEPLLRVLLVDDEELIVKALAVLLTSAGVELGIQIVGTANDGNEAIIQVQRQKPDLVMMDMRMPKVNGDEATKHIKRHLPHIKIIMLSSFDTVREVRLAKIAGADGYVYKSDSPTSVISVIKLVMQGDSGFVSSYETALLDGFGTFELTPRQMQVLKLLMRGEQNKSIAHTLNISVRTVEKHRGFLMKKLDYPNPEQLAIVAQDMGFIDK